MLCMPEREVGNRADRQSEKVMLRLYGVTRNYVPATLQTQSRAALIEFSRRIASGGGATIKKRTASSRLTTTISSRETGSRSCGLNLRMLPIEYLYTYTRGNSSIEGPLAVLSIGVRGKRSAKVQNQQLFRANIILQACASMKNKCGAACS